MLTQDASLDLVPQRLLADERVPLPGPLVPESPFPFVGRASEVARLHALLERAEGGEGSLVLLTGEPGAGKTRLVRELSHTAAGRGALVLYGVSDAVVSTPYQPLREWLAFLLRVCRPDALEQAFGSEGGQLARLVPELEQLGISATEAGDAEADQLSRAECGDESPDPARTCPAAAADRRRPALGRHRDAPACSAVSHAPLRSRGCSSSLRTAIPARR